MKKLLSILLPLAFTALLQANENPLPKMTMTDTNGKSYNVTGTAQGLKIEGLEGKVVFLEFFGHKCPPCLASIPHLIDMKKKHKDKIAIIAIEVQGYNKKQITDFVKLKGINYIVVAQQQASQLVDYIQQRAQWQGSIPFLVAMDTKGDVQFVQAGMLPESTLEQLFTQLSKPKTVEKK